MGDVLQRAVLGAHDTMSEPVAAAELANVAGCDSPLRVPSPNEQREIIKWFAHPPRPGNFIVATFPSGDTAGFGPPAGPVTSSRKNGTALNKSLWP